MFLQRRYSEFFDPSMAQPFLERILTKFCNQLEDPRYFRFFLDRAKDPLPAEQRLIAEHRAAFQHALTSFVQERRIQLYPGHPLHTIAGYTPQKADLFHTLTDYAFL